MQLHYLLICLKMFAFSIRAVALNQVSREAAPAGITKGMG